MIKNIFNRFKKKKKKGHLRRLLLLRCSDTRSAAKKQKLGVNLGPPEGWGGLNPFYTSDLTKK